MKTETRVSVLVRAALAVILTGLALVGCAKSEKTAASGGKPSVVTIVRVAGDRTALEYFRREGLVPGAKVRVISRQRDAGLATLSVAGREAIFAMSTLGRVFFEAPHAERASGHADGDGARNAVQGDGAGGGA